MDHCIRKFLDKLYVPYQSRLHQQYLNRIIDCSSIFRNIFCEFEDTFVQIGQGDITTMQCKSYLSV